MSPSAAGTRRANGPPSSRLRGWLAEPATPALLAAWIAGLLLRLWNLPAQLLGGDEVHVVRAALELPLGEILTTFQATDHCPPLAGLFHLATLAGLDLSGSLLRLPSLLAGMALLVGWPLWLRRRLGSPLGPPVAALAAWLLAISPLSVFYSRIVRSYAPATLLAMLAIACFFEWWRRVRVAAAEEAGSAGEARSDAAAIRHAAGYAIAAAAAVYFHLLAAPLVLLGPFLFAFGELALSGDRRSRRWLLGRLLALAAGAAVALAALLLPAAGSLIGLLSSKGGRGAVTVEGLLGAAQLLAGSGWLLVAAVVWLLAVLGFRRLLAADGTLARYFLTLAAAQAGAILLLSPYGVDHPLVLTRYLVFLLPLLLAGAAVGLAALSGLGTGETRAGRLARLRPAIAVAALLLLAAAGPFATAAYRFSSFVHHNDLMSFHQPLVRPEGDSYPPLYGELDAPGAVLELPWVSRWRYNRTFLAYQLVHRRPVLVAPLDGQLWDERLALPRQPPPRPPLLLASGARYLVLHRDPAGEEALVRPGEGELMPPSMARQLRGMAERMERRLRRRWGPPDHAGWRLVIWDLERVREERAATERAPTPLNSPG